MSKKIIKLKQSDLVKQVKKLINEQNENSYDVRQIFEKYFESSCDSSEVKDVNDRYDYGDAIIDNIYDSALSEGLLKEEDKDDFKNDLKDAHGESILDSFKGEDTEEDINEEQTDFKQLRLGIDEDGKYYIVDPETNKIIATTK